MSGSLKHLNIDDIDAFVLDFDGVITNNFVYLNEDGKESVRCSRADGLAFDLLRKIDKPSFLLSTEKNSVVALRGKKLMTPVIQGVSDKVKALYDLAERQGYELQRVCYVGNDLNDYRAMEVCGFTACPSDSHPAIKKSSDIILKTKGGNGVLRELLEDVFNLDFVSILFPVVGR